MLKHPRAGGFLSPVLVLAIRAENQMIPDPQEFNPSMGMGQVICLIGMDGPHNGPISNAPT